MRTFSGRTGSFSGTATRRAGSPTRPTINGSLDNIAGIINEEGNVLGLMPHPERASEALLGSEDGRIILESLIASIEGARRRKK